MTQNTKTQKITSQEVKPLSFVPRFIGAFGQFFKYMGSGDYAARCQHAGKGDVFAFEAEPTVITETIETIREIEVAAPILDTVNEDGAHQLLQLLQQEARFIDFLQESIDDYADADVGAAARQIHSGCAKVLNQHFTIDVVNSASENSRVEIPAGYDAKQIKLEGRVEGSGPYAGTLIHPGWKVTDTRLPKVTNTENLTILAPAEVEV
ncbi:hypothetical protein MUS1_09920 [Marinomonas ushuaiensis DSM 15871]|uniref:DUF2760 domain-containing protein n=1 Tax=Marinomonas ushuaiensis DSM 15871 TaxID=1122207 RepID=X7E8V0_9GAMM|nr:DUF2760 domain-containing protein [Marinomonas ushuaiensis]ETX11578.1 hypothetical protein MUS1_09920 [Marinomonas ushuaiensis DSM 15871]